MVITLLTLLFAAVFFVWGRLRSDVVALMALVVLTVSGVLTTGEALSGFSNSIVIMMIGLFVVGGAIFRTGLAKMIGARMLRLAGDSELKLFLLVMLVTSVIGAFVSNTGTVALMLPIVVSMAAGTGMGASRLLMPLAFASSMGGMMTLIGTPPNLIIEEALADAGFGRLSFFSFFPAGIVCLVAGTLILIPLSKWFLSGRGEAGKKESVVNKSLSQLVDEYGLNSDLYRVVVDRHSQVRGKTIGGMELRRRFDLDVLEVRSGEGTRRGIMKNIVQHAADPSRKLHTGDVMYLRGNASSVEAFAREYGLKMYTPDDKRGLEFYDIGMAEIVFMPSSRMVNRTIADIGFRNRYNVNVIAVRRKSQYLRNDLAGLTIKSGDVLLVQGSWHSIGELGNDSADWVVLGQPLAEAAKVTLDYKAPLAAMIMAAMVVMMVFDFVPVTPVMAVMIAAILMVLTGCFRNVEAAYNTINWESVVLIGAMMPMSMALEKTGVSEMVSSALVHGLGDAGPLALMAGIYFTTSLMTMFISNTATAVLVAPIALQSALSLGLNPVPFLFAVTFGASMCFASPFSTPPNALVMPAGQYAFMDYVKVGLPLQVLIGVIMIFILPVIFPF